MATYLPVGLSYLLPSSGAEISFNPTDIISANGKIGPLVFRFTNKDLTNQAVVGYNNELNPDPTPLEYGVLSDPVLGGNQIGLEVAIVPGESATFLYELPGWETHQVNVGATYRVYGDQIGGTNPENNLIFEVTNVDIVYENLEPVSWTVTSMDFISGTIPTTVINTSAPTVDNPAKVIIIPPGVTEYVEIPTSSNGKTILKASGGDVYVTPVQLIA